MSESPQTPETTDGPRDYGNDVRRLRVRDREFVIVGTAHVSRESSDLVREVIRNERPDHVCVELDEQRYEALSQKTNWENLDLRQIIRQKRLATLLVHLLLASFQKKLGDKLGVAPGTELLEATRAADEAGIPVSLCDRNIRVTMLRAWRSMSPWQKAKLMAGLLGGMLDNSAIDEDELRKLRDRDVLSEVMNELAAVMPALKRVLLDERDTYLAEKIHAAEGQRIVAVVGAGHAEGIQRALQSDERTPLEPIDQIPKVSPAWAYVGWGIPLIIVSALATIAWTQGSKAAGENLQFWILANGVPSGIGAVLALAHPLTILAAVVAAPITSLTPVIGAGYVTAFVQAWVRPPRVRDFEAVAEDAGVLRRWWSNRLLRVLLAFVLPTLGSLIGTYVGAAEILSNLF